MTKDGWSSKSVRNRFKESNSDDVPPGRSFSRSQHHQQQSSSSQPKVKSYLPSPTLHMFFVLMLVVAVFVAVIIIEKQLPPGLRIKDEGQHPNRFIAERAYEHLISLTSMGPRIAGSPENEEKAVQVLVTAVNRIIAESKDIHVIELDVQRTSGSFNLEFLDGMTNVYKDLQNVVVRMGSRINSPHSLLINCHFDTVAASPGASDDGAGCAVMLEIMRVLSKTDSLLRHNIIFLFNGGEENFMPASHGFITQHKWAKEIRAFINLEACGAGGREILFQAGPNHPWILETYAEEVLYPYASSLAQEIFQSKIIPGDTDFRIFRDFGNLSGLDFAWTSNGYIYHTKFDTVAQIPLGSLQRTGDNILALAKGMASGHQLEQIEKHRPGNLVFFDFLGAFVVRWPEVYANFINITAVILSLYTIHSNMKHGRAEMSQKKYVRQLLKCSGIVLVTWLASLIAGLMIAMALNALGRTMSWYARPIWFYLLYVVPTFFVSMSILLWHSNSSSKTISSAWTRFQLYYNSYQLIWTIILIVGIMFRIRSSFIPLLWSLFPALGNLLQYKLFGHWKDSRWLLIYVATIGLPFVQSFYLLQSALYLFIPIMGRVGAGNNSEIMVAAMVTILFSWLCSYVMPIILLVRNPDRIISLLTGLFLLSFAVLLLTPLGFPYSGDPTSLAPQRFMMANTLRRFHDEKGKLIDEQNGIWIADMDINSPHSVSRYVPEVNNARMVAEDCDKYLYCGLPYLVPVTSFIWKTHWIPFPGPKLGLDIVMQVAKREPIPGGQRLHFNITGSSHNGVMLSPMKDVHVTKWSLADGNPLPGPKWHGRDTYFIYYSYVAEPAPLQFSIDLSIPSGHTGPVLDIAVTSHVLFGPGSRTKEFQRYLDSFPHWTAVNAWSAIYESWIV